MLAIFSSVSVYFSAHFLLKNGSFDLRISSKVSVVEKVCSGLVSMALL